jgi:methylsterol monooxygenase
MGVLIDLFEWWFTVFEPFWAISLGTFILHEIFYFGLYIPYIIVDQIPSLHKYKIQKVVVLAAQLL